MAIRPATAKPAAKPAPNVLASRLEICVLRAANGWVVFDAQPGNMLRQPVLVAESPSKLADIISAWAVTQSIGGHA